MKGNMVMKKQSVVQDWVTNNCSMKMQTVLFCALRGCDGVPKEDNSKASNRFVRSLVLFNAATSDSSFMKPDLTKIREFIRDLDHYPVHFVTHQMHAFEIIGYCHNLREIRNMCCRIYEAFTTALHVKTETKSQMQKRLEDGKESDDLNLLLDKITWKYGEQIPVPDTEEVDSIPSNNLCCYVGKCRSQKQIGRVEIAQKSTREIFDYNG